MYLDHFGLHEAPFAVSPHPDFFFEGGHRGTILEALIFAITHDQGILKVTGEAGSGKTMLCRMLIERLPSSVETICMSSPGLSWEETLRSIAQDLKMKPPLERSAVLLRDIHEYLIKRHSQGGQVVLLIDEAHALSLEGLEQIRLLSQLESQKHKLIHIVLFGQPELDELLKSPKIHKLKERITHGFKLHPLNDTEVHAYLKFRLRAAGYRGPDLFTLEAARFIAEVSEGWVRRVNILADKTLLAAATQGVQVITPKQIKAALLNVQGTESAWWYHNKIAVAGSAFLVGVFLGFGLHYLGPLLRTASAERTVMNGVPLPDVSPWMTSGVPLAQAKNPPSLEKDNKNKTNGGINTSTLPKPSNPESLQKAQPIPLSGKEPSGKLAKARLQATRDWLKQVPPNHYFLQLMLANPGVNPQLESFLKKAGTVVNLNDIYIYPSQLRGQAMLGIIYGNFESEKKALEAIKTLPAHLKAHRPHPRAYSRIKEAFESN